MKRKSWWIAVAASLVASSVAQAGSIQMVPVGVQTKDSGLLLEVKSLGEAPTYLPLSVFGGSLRLVLADGKSLDLHLQPVKSGAVEVAVLDPGSSDRLQQAVGASSLEEGLPLASFSLPVELGRTDDPGVNLSDAGFPDLELRVVSASKGFPITRQCKCGSETCTPKPGQCVDCGCATCCADPDPVIQ